MEGSEAKASRHARVVGSPGEWARFTGTVRIVWPLLVFAAVCGYLVRAAWPFPPLGQTVAGFMFLLLAGGLAWLTGTRGRHLDAYLKGARGEERVARALAFLPASFTVFHGVNLGRRGHLRGGDYDHIVVGPSGMFLVETKNWRGAVAVREGRVLVDGAEPDRPPLEQVRGAAAELTRALGRHLGAPPEVQPLLCFVGHPVEGGSRGVEGVIVCGLNQLSGVIQAGCGTPLDEETRRQVLALLEKHAGS